MLKLGDKILMGIIIPTILVALLVALPYIDRNPYRSLYKRPMAVAIGILAVLVLVVLSYMGTPVYGIATRPPSASSRTWHRRKGKARCGQCLSTSCRPAAMK